MAFGPAESANVTFTALSAVNVALAPAGATKVTLTRPGSLAGAPARGRGPADTGGD